MANERRVYANLGGGLVEDNPLAAAATTLTSAGLAPLPAIGSTEHLVVVFDPDGLTGVPYAKRITAHTAGASTATIEAAALSVGEMGATRDVPRDTPWVATMLKEDVPNHAFARRASTDLTLNSTSWANLDTALDLAVPAVAGDTLVASISGFFGSDPVNAYLDAVTLVAGSPLNSFARAAAVEASPGTLGVSGWIAAASAFSTVGPPIPYTVVAGDVVSGVVTVRFRYATGAASNRTLRATSSQPLAVFLQNLRQQRA